jgi:hypothetical protein
MTPPEEKPCTHCAVGWMVLRIVTDGGRTRWVYYCAACGHADPETPR